MKNKKLKESTFSSKYEGNLKKKYNFLSKSYQVKEQKNFSDEDGYNVFEKPIYGIFQIQLIPFRWVGGDRLCYEIYFN